MCMLVARFASKQSGILLFRLRPVRRDVEFVAGQGDDLVQCCIHLCRRSLDSTRLNSEVVDLVESRVHRIFVRHHRLGLSQLLTTYGLRVLG